LFFFFIAGHFDDDKILKNIIKTYKVTKEESGKWQKYRRVAGEMTKPILNIERNYCFYNLE
jgi:hypothetical protein